MWTKKLWLFLLLAPNPIYDSTQRSKQTYEQLSHEHRGNYTVWINTQKKTECKYNMSVIISGVKNICSKESDHTCLGLLSQINVIINRLVTFNYF